ncbi:MAG TPA: hypothetical protein ENH12_06850 [Proteobacteria bacterium]|nr:hypothetical protein [Pseudomonadota bacterium]
MKQIVLNIKDDSKISVVRNFFKTINFIEVIPETEEAEEKGEGNFEDLFGLWKDRDISIDDIRAKAWARK